MQQGKSELIAALDQLEKGKGIRKDEVLKMIEGAMISSLRKHVGKNAVIEASIDPETAEFNANVVKTAVEAVQDPELEISLQEARRHKPDAVLGEVVRLPAPATDFARIAAQTAKQVLSQKIREVERDSLFEEFKSREGQIITGSVHRMVDRTIIAEMGRIEGVLPLREQIRRERYAIGQSLRAVVLRVERGHEGPRLILSRADPLFLRRLLELEVPEIQDKSIEIVEIIRIPGQRAKVLLKTNDPKIDPVGACIGVRGARIRGIMGELSGERIDLIAYSDNPETLIENALAPAKVAAVRLVDKAGRRAEAVVSDDQLPAALGKEGQNVSLAARLVGWSIEIKSKSQAIPPRRAEPETAEPGQELLSLEGVGPKTAEALVEAGYGDPAAVAAADVAVIAKVKGIGDKTAAKILASAKEFVEGRAASSPSDPAAGGGREAIDSSPPAERQAPKKEKAEHTHG